MFLSLIILYIADSVLSIDNTVSPATRATRCCRQNCGESRMNIDPADCLAKQGAFRYNEKHQPYSAETMTHRNRPFEGISTVINPFQKYFDYLLDHFSKACFRYYEKRWKRLLVVITLGILAIVLLLGWMSAKKVRETVLADFNQQQLVLARHAAQQVENFLDIVKREMLLLSRHPSLRSPDPSFLEKVLPISFDLLGAEGLVEIRFFDSASDLVYRVVPQGGGFAIVKPDAKDRELLVAAHTYYEDTMFHVSSQHNESQEIPQHKTLLYIAKPVYSGAGASPDAVRANFPLRGILICVVDGFTVAERALKNIRSGKTGYAWMIDRNGIFLYHPVPEFIGKNAFSARKEHGPSISFMQIDKIQREKMLKGEEGMSWYLSGWHLGVKGEIKKLIAFSPIRVTQQGDSIAWSVAVVAPMSEIDGAISEVQFRQNLLEGSIIFFVLIGSFITFMVMAKWSSALKDEVQRKTDELLQSENQYSSLVEHANDIIYTIDRNGDFLTINKAGADFFHKLKEEIIGNNIGTICYNEESYTRQFKAIDEVFTTGGSRQIVYSITINNAEIWVSASYSLISGRAGSKSAVLVISRDVTERKRSEERMYHTEKLASLGTLAAGVAHEINNPLAIILGFTDLLLEKTPRDSESYDTLKTIEKQGNNAKRVVENLLSFARYREGRDELIEVNSSIEDVLTVAGNTLRLSKIVVHKQLTQNLPVIKGDSREIQQVFLNIINNAIYAMKGHGILTIETGANAKGDVEIRLADTGHGIKKEHRSKIFDPLFTTKVVGEGTGLGLSVCYAIVSKYGGTITFKTKTEDEIQEKMHHVSLDDGSIPFGSGENDMASSVGTTFIITLPVAKN